MKVIIKHPHIEEKHIKHFAAINILTGTLLEIAHFAYPSGLILLMLAGCVAVYEPQIVQSVKVDLEDNG